MSTKPKSSRTESIYNFEILSAKKINKIIPKYINAFLKNNLFINYFIAHPWLSHLSFLIFQQTLHFSPSAFFVSTIISSPSSFLILST